MNKQGRKTCGLFGTTNSNLTNDKVVIKELRFSEIDYHVDRNEIITPEFQRKIDEVKVEEIKKEIVNNNNYLLHCTNPIQLASIQTDNKKWKHYILDGQHRFMAIKELAKNIPNVYQNFALHLCDNEKGAITIFKKLIKGQENNYLISEEIFDEDFRSSRQYKFREYLTKQYPEHFVPTEKNKWVYSIDQFLLELNKKGFFGLKKYKNNIQMKDLLFKRLKKFCSKINYELKLENNPKLLYKKEKEILEICQNQCLGLKNNNFIDYIFTSKTSKIIPEHHWKTAKDTISNNLKEQVWTTYFGQQQKKQCPIENCKRFINCKAFSTGHIISEANKGKIELNNLYPLCSRCNSSMGSKNWIEYDIISYNKIISKQESLGI